MPSSRHSRTVISSTAPETPRLTSLVARQDVLLVGGLAAVTAVSWLYLFRLAQDMDGMGHCAEMMMPGADGMSIGWILAMWVVMMVAMMVPTAAPMTLLYARFCRGHSPSVPAVLPTSLFLVGYVVAWTLFSAAATALQVGLQRIAVMSLMDMKLVSPAAGGVILIVAGLFQWTSWKNACLSRCRSPIGFFMTEWRDGTGGAFVMGLHHGLFCLGCCWALMLLLFVLGTMNMLWIAALTALVLIEKVAPHGDLVARAVGVAMVGVGMWMIAV
jgi:predicted metal-binding membrane protein